jgi:ferredoxin
MSSAFTLQAQPLGVTLALANGQSLLEAALGVGLVLRSACRNGTCRECMARVPEGRVHHRIDWPGLSAEERSEGWVLPCVTVADSDVVLLQPRVGAPR